jgi:radical SAM protein with 4Fe4S-binding SPASM domain
LSQVANAYGSSNVFFQITGGEPLLREDIFEITEYANNLGFQWGMVTNATLITEKTISDMNRTNIYSLSISIDGLESHHDALRGVGSYAKSYERLITSLKNVKAPLFEIITCINQFNIDSLEEMYQFYTKLDIHLWCLNITSAIGRAKTNNHLLLKPEQYKKLYDFILEKRKNPCKVILTSCDEGYLGEKYELKVRDYMYNCSAGVNLATILSNGDIFGCPSISREVSGMIEGNIRTDNFVDVWENKFKAYRNRKWMKTGKCKKCSNFSICQGNSLHLWDFERNETGFCHMDVLY